MATDVSVTASELFIELRLGGDGDAIPQETNKILTQLVAASKAYCCHYSPDSPADVLKRAIILMTGYLYEVPGLRSASSAFRMSGAKDLLAPWRTHNLGVVAVSEM